MYISFVRRDRYDLLTICSVVCMNRYWTLTTNLRAHCAHTALRSAARSDGAPLHVCVLCLRRVDDQHSQVCCVSLVYYCCFCCWRWRRRPLFRSMPASHYSACACVRLCQCVRASEGMRVWWMRPRVCRTTPRFRMAIHAADRKRETIYGAQTAWLVARTDEPIRSRANTQS